MIEMEETKASEASESDFEKPDYKDFLSAVSKRFCPRCGAPVGYKGRGRPRVYCSDQCRWATNKKKERRRNRKKKIIQFPDWKEGEKEE